MVSRALLYWRRYAHALLVTTLISACGRIAFDPLGAGTFGNDAGGSSSDAAPIQSGTCGQPVALAFGENPIDTCATTDMEPGCGGTSPEVVVAFTPPSTNYYDVIANGPLMLASNLTTSCPGGGSGGGICANSLGMTFQGGATYVFVVETLDSSCAQGTVTVQ